MADWRQETRRAAERYGLDPGIFERQIQQESGFNPSARSGAGALGIAQIMPATARGWGVDPLNPRAALDAAAKNMARYVKQYGSYRDALVAYNAGPGRVGKPLYSETANYVKTILGGQNPTRVASTPRSSGSPDSAAGGLSAAPAAPASIDGGQAGDFTSLLATLAAPRQQAPSSSLPGPPNALALPEGFRPLAPAQREEAPAQDAVSASLGLLEALKGSGPTVGSSEGSGGSEAPGVLERVMAQRAKGVRSQATTNAPLNDGGGAFEVSGPNPGRLKPELVSFAEKVARIYGGPLVGKDGSTHSKYTVNGNVSEHYSGNATDIFEIGGKPAQGKVLLEAGRAALIAAGMPRAQALKAKGGLYNVGKHQIIFLTNQGGNHYDHLHISTHAG